MNIHKRTKKLLLTTTALIMCSIGVEAFAVCATSGNIPSSCTLASNPTGALTLGSDTGSVAMTMTINSDISMGTHGITSVGVTGGNTNNDTLAVTGGTVNLYNVGDSLDSQSTQGIFLHLTGGTTTLGAGTNVYGTAASIFGDGISIESGATLILSPTSTLSIQSASNLYNNGDLKIQVADGSTYGRISGHGTINNGGVSGTWVINPTATLAAGTIELTDIISLTGGAWDFPSTFSCTQSGCTAELVDTGGGGTAFKIVLTITGGGSSTWANNISNQPLSVNQRNVIVPLEAITDTTVTTALNNSVTNGNTLQMIDAAAGRAQPSSVVASQIPSATTNVVSNRMALVRSDFSNDGDFTGMSGISSGDKFDMGILKPDAIWVQPFASHTHQSTKNLISGYKTNTGGLAVGADTVLMDKFTAGAAISYADTHLKGRDSGNTRNHIETVQGTLYGSYAIDKQWYTEAMAYYGYNTYREHSDIPNGIGRRSGKYHGYQLGAKVGVGYKFKYDSFDITPKVSVDYNHLHTNRYSERGAGALNRTINKSNYNVSTADAIVNFAHPIKVKDGGIFIPSLNIGAGYDIKSGSISNTATFAGATANPFNLQGIKPARASVKGGANLTYKFDKTMSVAADYMYEKRSKAFAHSAFLNLRMDF